MHGAMMFVHMFKTWSGLSRHFAPVLRGIELDVGLGGVVVVDLGTCRIPKKTCDFVGIFTMKNGEQHWVT